MGDSPHAKCLQERGFWVFRSAEMGFAVHRATGFVDQALEKAMAGILGRVVWHVVCVELNGVVCDRLFFEQAGFWILSLG